MKSNPGKLRLFLLILITGIILTGCGQTGLDSSATESNNSFSGEYYDLQGTWGGFAHGHGYFRHISIDADDLVYMDTREDELLRYEFVIEGQNGRVFWGTKIVYLSDSQSSEGEEMMIEEGFSGAFERDSNNFYIVEHEDGLAFGKVLSDGEIEIIYKENEEQPRILIYELSRK